MLRAAMLLLFVGLILSLFLPQCVSPTLTGDRTMVSPPVTAKEQLDHFDKILSKLKAAHGEQPLEAWPPHARDLWNDVRPAREAFLQAHPELWTQQP